MVAAWTTSPVTDLPHLTLIRWRILETERGERHFVGHCLEHEKGRVSSAIDRFDAEAGRGLTRSGRVYQLSGSASHDPDANYVWAVWARLNQVPWFRDVTGDIEALLKPARLH